VNLLLDTHVLLWWLDDSPDLSHRARAQIADGRNPVFVSAVVVWEIRIKQALGELEIPPNFREILDHPTQRALARVWRWSGACGWRRVVAIIAEEARAVAGEAPKLPTSAVLKERV